VPLVDGDPRHVIARISSVVPAQAGTQRLGGDKDAAGVALESETTSGRRMHPKLSRHWVPACAGTTTVSTKSIACNI